MSCTKEKSSNLIQTSSKEDLLLEKRDIENLDEFYDKIIIKYEQAKLDINAEEFSEQSVIFNIETIQIIPEKIDTLKEYSDQIKQSNDDEYFTIIKLNKIKQK